MTVLKDKGIEYTSDQKLELRIMLYLAEPHIRFHDVDNRLKDIMDSLQGRMGGSKKERTFKRLILNDSQIYKVTIEKRQPPIQSHGLGHLEIRKYSENTKQMFKRIAANCIRGIENRNKTKP